MLSLALLSSSCRFKSLQKPLDLRRSQLEVSVLLFVFYHDVDLELSWISEHVPASGSTAQDKCLAGALSLTQKHKVLEILTLSSRQM